MSCDMKFDEEATWRWEANEKATYDFFPCFGKEDQDIITLIQEEAPSPSLVHERSSSFEESSSEKPRKM